MSSRCLDAVDFHTLRHNRSGLEREMLRVTPGHRVAASPHPAALGHKLSHPRITVDFSEGLLELVSPPFESRPTMLAELARLHNFVARGLADGEKLWPLSMPPSATPDEILIADFGPSLSGRMKQVYRQGLANRYGKIMQIIAGVHYNFSFDPAFVAHMHETMGRELAPEECRNRLYFRLIRGFDRHAWLLPYLFGASPVAAKTSNGLAADWLQALDDEHVGGEYATSLRMSEIGYQSPAQAELEISHAGVADYVRELVAATRTPWPEYQALGIKVDGHWRQLNGNILQIENEYYSAIRPKQSVQLGERPACALHTRGVEYIELRMLDVDPFEPLGIGRSTAEFLEVFLLWCLSTGSEVGDWTREDKANQQASIRRGREPGLQLRRGGQLVPLVDWAAEVLAACDELALRLDAVHGGSQYAAAVAAQTAKLQDPRQLPSQRVLDEASAAGGYGQWAARLSDRHSQDLARADLPGAEQSAFEAQAARSFQEAEQLARQQTGSFDDYVAAYYESLCEESSAALGLAR